MIPLGAIGPGMERRVTEHRRVLVVDDEENLRHMIAVLLEDEGYRVEQAADGAEALARLDEAPSDFVVSDLRMPKIDGLEFTRSYRAQETGERRLPIIALTANAAEDMRQETLEAGMVDFLTKPVDPEELDEIIRRYRPVAA